MRTKYARKKDSLHRETTMHLLELNKILRRIHVVIDVMDLQAIYREREPEFIDLATGRLQYFG